MTIDETSNGRVLSVPAGEAIEICLGEIRTAGYRWTVEDAGEPMMALESERFHAPTHTPLAGKHVWRFRAQHAGASRIRLSYRFGWSSAAPLRTFELVLAVADEARAVQPS